MLHGDPVNKQINMELYRERQPVLAPGLLKHSVHAPEHRHILEPVVYTHTHKMAFESKPKEQERISQRKREEAQAEVQGSRENRRLVWLQAWQDRSRGRYRYYCLHHSLLETDPTRV